jgi:4a-hydroxytetrahydrobiopterin dehydratase
MTLLTRGEADRRLNLLDGWTLDGDSIRREFLFPGFAESLAFVNRVGTLAESMDHHPDITILYNKVILTLSTHSQGGLTEKDFELAGRIDRTARAS